MVEPDRSDDDADRLRVEGEHEECVPRVRYSPQFVAECRHGAEAVEAILDRQPDVVFLDIRMPGLDGLEVAEAIPFIALTDYREDQLYSLKGEIVSRGIAAVTGLKMPVFPKRRFQHGAVPEQRLRKHLPAREADLRKEFLAIYQ